MNYTLKTQPIGPISYTFSLRPDGAVLACQHTKRESVLPTVAQAVDLSTQLLQYLYCI